MMGPNISELDFISWPISIKPRFFFWSRHKAKVVWVNFGVEVGLGNGP